MTDVRALTLHQPWASLVAVGVKTIETRSWPTEYRGRLLIHAAARKPPIEMLEDGYAGELFASDEQTLLYQWCQSEGNPRPDEWWLYDCSPGGSSDMWPLPLGAVVASAMLTDCIPIVESTGETEPRDEVYQTYDGGSLAIQRLTGDGSRPEHVHTEWVTDQLPFGDFAPGRWAWLLDDVKPTTERCPRCWNTGWIEYDNGEHDRCCNAPGPQCALPFGHPGVEPVPMRGKQRLWTPTWEVAS